jgi:hypothetical protein
MKTLPKPGKKARNIPIEAEAMGGWDAPTIFEDGNLAPVEGRSNTVEYVKAGAGKWKSHFVSCPERDEWRRR